MRPAKKFLKDLGHLTLTEMATKSLEGELTDETR